MSEMSKIEKAAHLADQLRNAMMDARTEMTQSESFLFNDTIEKIVQVSTTLDVLATIQRETE